MWGKLFHFAADAMLITTVLAGIKRNTGLQIATSKIEDNNIRSYLDKYLDFGDTLLDQAVYQMQKSGYFERK
ncbi:uncharacterized protein BYT42DRAFT_618074 [Radiomyces spectabilis]|uniref:uncharacterized protein n=1 Tax=Radiomyces spectabilis TaxID=64574 RepID=UPI00221F85C4|nr:uncharacterized protein BYT42DRAFT_618074 [Radiomyces spectabilis]KAI8367657.1 hypothetical protein BYT42DRAFT_618074 [Radiomyces spectabilis]